MARVVSPIVCLLATAGALQLPSVMPSARRCTDCSMGMFDGFSKAFENDSSLGKPKNAGLSKEKNTRTITWVGPGGQKKTSTIVPGQRLKDIARGTGIRIKYDCQEGVCKTCEAKVGGRAMKICLAKAPNKDVTIQYNIRG